MFTIDRFTERAQDAAARAFEILQRFGHSQVDTEHIFLALVQQPEGLVSGIIDKLGADPNVLSSKLNDVLQASPGVNSEVSGATTQVFITSRVAQMLNLASEEVNRLKDEHIGTEHLFLAISTEHDTPSAQILADVGITHDKIMDIILTARNA